MSRPKSRSGDHQGARQLSSRSYIVDTLGVAGTLYTIDSGFSGGIGILPRLVLTYVPTGTWIELHFQDLDLDIGVNRMFFELPTLLANNPRLPPIIGPGITTAVYRGTMSSLLFSGAATPSESGDFFYRTDNRLELAFTTVAASAGGIYMGRLLVPRNIELYVAV